MVLMGSKRTHEVSGKPLVWLSPSLKDEAQNLSGENWNMIFVAYVYMLLNH